MSQTKAASSSILSRWLLVGVVIASLSWALPTILNSLPPSSTPPSANKPYSDLESFRTRYANDHQDQTSVYLHATGTSIYVLIALVTPELIPATLLAGLTGQIVCPLLRHHDTGIVEACTALVIYFNTTKFLYGSLSRASLVLFCGYSFAWVGHFFYERNTPATFIYPTYSLICDFYMWMETLTGMSILTY